MTTQSHSFPMFAAVRFSKNGHCTCSGSLAGRPHSRENFHNLAVAVDETPKIDLCFRALFLSEAHCTLKYLSTNGSKSSAPIIMVGAMLLENDGIISSPQLAAKGRILYIGTNSGCSGNIQQDIIILFIKQYFVKLSNHYSYCVLQAVGSD